MQPRQTSDRAAFLIAVLWSTCLFAALLAFVPMCWQDTDDLRMSMIAAGIGSPDGPSPTLVYMNVVTGHVLSWLYTKLPDIPWYTWMHIASHVLAATAIAFVTIAIRVRQAALVSLAALQMALTSYLWIHLQFTTTAAMLAIGGVSLVVLGLSRPSAENRFRILLSGCVLLTLSSLVRIQALQLVLILSAVCLAMTFWQHRVLFSPAWDGLLAAVSLGVIGGAILWNNSVYRSDPELEKFRTDLVNYAPVVNSIRVKLFLLDKDRSSVLGESAKKDATARLKEMGLGWNDVSCLKWWYFFDEDVYSSERLARLNAVFAGKARLRYYVLMLLGTLPIILFQSVDSNLFLLFPGIAIGLMIRAGTGRRQIIACLLTWAAAVGVMVMLLGVIKLPPRVYLPIGASCCMATLLISFIRPVAEETTPASNDPEPPADTEKPPSSPVPERTSGRIWLSVMMLGAVYVAYGYLATINETAAIRKKIDATVEQLRERDDALHVLLVPFPFSYLDPLHSQNHLKDWPFIYLDGHQRSPRQKSIIQQRLGQPLPEAMLAHPGVRLVVEPTARSLPHIREFYRTHYGLEVSFPVDERLPWGTIRRIESRRAGSGVSGRVGGDGSDDRH